MNVQSEQAEEALSAEEVLSNAVNSYFTRSSSLQDHQNQSEAADEAELTNLLFYSRWPLDDPEETMRRLLTKGPRQVCQYQFKKNDIVWICKSCQKDETCVLCNECFQDSEGKHEGHEVYFYHSQAGGCCDCGDEGAWDAKGFCNKHGKSSSDPMESIPDDIQEAGRYVMSQIARELVNYCEKIASSFDIESLEVSSSVDDEKVYNLLLHNDDIHTLDDVVSALESLDIAPSSGKSIAEMVHAEGCAVLGDRDTLSVIINRAKTVLTVCDLHVSIEEHNFLQRENTVLAVIRWLHRIAEVNDGMSRMICASLTIERIHAIYVTDPRLPKNIAIHLHHLFLTLMADQEFKIASSKAYALAYSKVAKLYVNGIGTQENCLFGLSVQFLNRSIYVDGMVYNYGFLNSVITSLRNILEPTEGRFATHPILLHRKYNPVLGDLKVIFTLPDTSRYFCVTCIDQMLKVFELFQFLHPQTRQLFQHVEYEGREWMHAFNLYLSFSSLFEYLVNWFVNESSVENIEGPVILDPLADDVDATQVFDPASVQILPTAIDLMMAIVSAIVGWQQSRAQAASIDCEAGRMWKRVPFFPSADNIAVVNDSDVARDDVTTTLVQRIDDKCDTAFETHFSTSFGFLDIPEDLEEKSFHLFLHRFLATSIREACRHPHLSDTIADLQQYLSVTYTDFTCVDDVDHHQNECQLTQLIDYPLQTIVWECQIRADMWRRNGHSMLDQILNYSEPPFCRIFKDLDILLIQVFEFCIAYFLESVLVSSRYLFFLLAMC
jgi:ATP-dependent Clp protease adapter protein ClpS